MATKRVLAIHDMCSFGRCSLTAALPVISSMGIQVCPFPTALFSNNLTYGDFTFTDFTPYMNGFMDKWQQLGFTYDGIYSGFLADAGQISIVRDAIRRFAGSSTLIVVDPAMADNGALYPVFKPDMVQEMKKLAADATVITPNYTEACFLLDKPYADAAPDRDELLSIVKALTAMGPKQVVITSVPAADGDIKVAAFDAATESLTERTTPRIPFSTCGTGDLFASVLTGSLLQGKSLDEAMKKAMTFVSYAIDYTYRSGSDYREGVQVEPCLPKLWD